MLLLIQNMFVVYVCIIYVNVHLHYRQQAHVQYVRMLTCPSMELLLLFPARAGALPVALLQQRLGKRDINQSAKWGLPSGSELSCLRQKKGKKGSIMRQHDKFI
jgi:hypothetical protein